MTIIDLTTVYYPRLTARDIICGGYGLIHGPGCTLTHMAHLLHEADPSLGLIDWRGELSGRTSPGTYAINHFIDNDPFGHYLFDAFATAYLASLDQLPPEFPEASKDTFRRFLADESKCRSSRIIAAHDTIRHHARSCGLCTCDDIRFARQHLAEVFNRMLDLLGVPPTTSQTGHALLCEAAASIAPATMETTP